MGPIGGWRIRGEGVRMKKWPVIVAVVMLVSTWGLLQSLSHGEPVLMRQPLATFPLTIGDRWQGQELGMEQKILDVLKLNDYMNRVYVPKQKARNMEKGGEGLLPVYLYVGYYQSQRTGSTYHSPKNCLPGAGWQFVESEQMVVPVSGGASITINKVLIEKGLDKQIILYWYQDRGRIIASEYWAKVYLVWDAMTQNRTDGALVKISVPVGQSSEQAFALGLAFLQEMFPLLSGHLPT